MECKAPDGRYLMRHRYQWWAVYHVLVRQCGFPDGYREFVACIAQLFPEGLRVPCTESTMKQLSQTHYMEPVRPETKLKKDVASGISLKRVSSDAMA